MPVPLPLDLHWSVLVRPGYWARIQPQPANSFLVSVGTGIACRRCPLPASPASVRDRLPAAPSQVRTCAACAHVTTPPGDGAGTSAPARTPSTTVPLLRGAARVVP